MTSPQAQTQSYASSAEELRNVQYVLAELARWEAHGVVSDEQANILREAYTRRENELQAQLANLKSPQDASKKQQRIATAKRPLLETVSDAYSLRLFLYTGAAMLVVGVVIWLRDALYLKLQEPIVQAGLLAFGTCATMAAGWFATLRTRQQLTGRALTLIGSLLVPINFWFLVRSGLISNNGRAWMVCALCTLLYGTTARLLREKLYVYLASVALIATVWAIIFRVEHEAFGLYALSLMIVSLALLHLSRLFPQSKDSTDEGLPSSGLPSSGWSRELWSAPLAHIALAGAAVSALCYMPLRLWASPSIDDGIFWLRTNDYDPAVAMLLFACAAYTAWFAGRFIYEKRRVFFYCLSTLALCWTEFLMLDAMRVSRLTTLLVLSLTALGLSVAAYTARNEALAKAFHPASLLVATMLALASCLVALLADSAHTWTHGATLFMLATVFAVSSATRFPNALVRSLLACASMLMLAVLFALHTSTQWFAAIFALSLFLPLLLLSRFTREHGNVWLEKFSFDAAGAVLPIAFAATLIESAAHLQTGNTRLFPSCVTTLEISALSFAAYALIKEEVRAHYFRAGLAAAISSYALWCLRAGYSPISEVEIYTTPVAVLLLVVAYLSMRGGQDAAKKARDAGAMLWTGSVLLCTPLCLRAFEARLLEGVPALSRDLALLCASLALIFFGATKRLRAPVAVGATALLAELSVLTLTSVDWAQVPLKIYLVTMGALIVFVCWCLEFRREQLLLVRKRISESRMAARERFGEWK